MDSVLFMGEAVCNRRLMHGYKPRHP